MKSKALFKGMAHNVIQAPMAGSQDHRLAIAVCEAGGLGSVPAAMLSAEQLDTQLTKLKQGTAQPYNVNFFAHTMPEFDETREREWRALLAPYYSELGIDIASVPLQGALRQPFNEAALEVVLEHKVPIASFHFGLPDEQLLAPLRKLGVKIISSATTTAEARWLAERGVDAVIAQGWEAGGHRGHFLADDMTTQAGVFALVQSIRRVVSLPIIAAGGIGDAQGAQAMRSLGAAAVQCGSAFLLCSEATTSAVHRSALQSDDAQRTRLTRLFSGRPARGIVNRLMAELDELTSGIPAFPYAGSALAPLRAAAEANGCDEFSPLWVGQNSEAAREVPAAEQVRYLSE